jgi:gliding motility-associated-like protein
VKLVTTIWLLLFTVCLFGQCIDTANFSRWTETNDNGHWQVNSPQEVVNNIEVYPTRPSFFVSKDQMINVKLSFDVECMGGIDDDFFGIVLGYRGPNSPPSENYNFILFDWKAIAESGFFHFAEEGFSLAAFHGNISPDDIHRYFWGHNSGASNSVYEPLSTSFGDGKGWEVQKKYHVDVIYTETSIKISIDDKMIFDVERCNQSGRIGFYTYSQYKVVYSNLSYRSWAEIFTSPTMICEGDTVFTNLMNPSCPGYDPALESWQWSWGDGEVSANKNPDYHIYQSGGNYPLELIAIFPGNCRDTISTEVTVESIPEFDLGPDTTIHAGENITISSGEYHQNWNYLWSTGSQLEQITLYNLESDTTISLLVTSSLCEHYDEVNITVVHDTIPKYHIYIPNVFTPDGDGQNDVFQPVTVEEFPDQYDLFIYDKWGTQIFSSTQPEQGWDGTYKGKLCQGDVYVYLIKYRLPARFQVNETSVLKGCLLLLR